MSDAVDEHFLRRAFRLAMNGRGRVEPNPMVGCVLVKDGRVIGEGYHQQFGGPHAEPNALANCTESPEGATAYVTLEPCCHLNKKTPPCAPRLIEAKIARVVVGCLDPNPDVNGKGLAMLREVGIEVAGPVLESEAKQLIAPFLKWVRHRLPYVTLKWAESADGKVAGAGGRPVQISNAASTRLVHELRARSDAIMVGIGTVLTDDPILNARYASRARHPSRFVLDRALRTPSDARIVRDRETPTTVLHGHDTTGPFRRRRDALNALGVQTTLVPNDDARRLSLADALRRVADAFCDELLVEPGPTLAASFLRSGLADRLWVIRSAHPVGDNPTAPRAPIVPPGYLVTSEIELDGDRLTEYLNPRSDVYFGPHPSADLVLAQA